MCPCYIPMLESVHLVKHKPTYTRNIHYILFSFIFWLCSILVISSSSFYYSTTFCLSFCCYESLFTSSLLTFFILLKINFLMDLLIFCTLRATWKEWEKKNAKSEMGKKIPHLYLVGQLSDNNLRNVLYLFIGFWKTLLLKCDISLLIFLHFFFLDIFSTNRKNANGCQKMCSTFIHWFPIDNINDRFCNVEIGY
jgi:hypothetical protein